MFLGLRELVYSKLRYILVTGIMVLIMLLSLILSGLANGLAYDNASSVADNGVPYYVLAKTPKTNYLISVPRIQTR